MPANRFTICGSDVVNRQREKPRQTFSGFGQVGSARIDERLRAARQCAAFLLDQYERPFQRRARKRA
jgi:hypothetical protein